MVLNPLSQSADVTAMESRRSTRFKTLGHDFPKIMFKGDQVAVAGLEGYLQKKIGNRFLTLIILLE